MVDVTTPIADGTVFKGVVVGGKVYPGKVLYDETGAEVIGLVTPSPGATTLLGRLKTIADALAGSLTVGAHALTAGTALIGKVKTKFIHASGTALTRVSDTNAYTANDNIANSVTAGSVTANSITVSDVNDDTFSIDRMRIATTDTGVAGKAVRAWLYNSDPTASSGVSGGDNAAFSNKMAGFVGTMSGTFRTFSNGSVAVLVPDEGARLVLAPGSGARTIWWQLQALEAFTPVSASTWTPTVEGFQGAA